MRSPVEHTTGTSAGDAAERAPSEQGQPAGSSPPEDRERASFAARGRARRRVRFLRKARELAYRDLGGLVYNLHRFGQRNDALVLAKLTTVENIDRELRALEASLGEREPFTVLREAGITACPRCAAIHSSEDRYCPNCGLALGPHAEHPAGLRPSVPVHVPESTEQAPEEAQRAPVGPPAAEEAPPIPATSPSPEQAPARAPQEAPPPSPAPAAEEPAPAAEEPALAAEEPAPAAEEPAPAAEETDAPEAALLEKPSAPAREPKSDKGAKAAGRARTPPRQRKAAAAPEAEPADSEAASTDDAEQTVIMRPSATGQ